MIQYFEHNTVYILYVYFVAYPLKSKMDESNFTGCAPIYS